MVLLGCLRGSSEAGGGATGPLEESEKERALPDMTKHLLSMILHNCDVARAPFWGSDVPQT
jgi:hypothetical protein